MVENRDSLFLDLYIREFEEVTNTTYCNIYISDNGLCIKKLKKDLNFVKGSEEEKKIIKEKYREHFLNCFDKEIKIYNELKDKNLENIIIKYFCGGRGVIFLENAVKGDIFKYIEYQPGIDVKIAKILFKKILISIDKIHKIGIVHLDLKPDNILLDKKFNPKICDFGYSEKESEKIDIENLSIPVGSSLFKSPEMLENKKYNGKKSDIFTLGITFYYILNGFELKKFRKINKDNYKEYLNDILLNAKNNFSPECFDVISKMLKVDEKERPSIEEILKHKFFAEEVNNSIKEEENIINEYFSKREKELDGNKEVNAGKKEAKYSSKEININKYFEFKEPEKYKKKSFNSIRDKMKIIGDLNYDEFMNILIDRLDKDEKYINKIKIEIKDNLEFEMTIKDENIDEEGDLKIRISLIQLEDADEKNCYHLKIIKLNGSIFRYYEYIQNIYKIAKEVAEETGI